MRNIHIFLHAHKKYSCTHIKLFTCAQEFFFHAHAQFPDYSMCTISYVPQCNFTKENELKEKDQFAQNVAYIRGVYL